MAAIGGIMAASRLLAVNQSSGGSDLLLLAIAGPVIAGTSLFGGRGSVWSALLGALVIGSISNGMDLLALESSVKFMVTGGVLLVAVIIDALARRQRQAAGQGLRPAAERASWSGVRTVPPRGAVRSTCAQGDDVRRLRAGEGGLEDLEADHRIGRVHRCGRSLAEPALDPGIEAFVGSRFGLDLRDLVVAREPPPALGRLPTPVRLAGAPAGAQRLLLRVEAVLHVRAVRARGRGSAARVRAATALIDRWRADAVARGRAR